ncbi:RagB/SusD family nutrient uptake outer membrane protein [Labilibaculum sp.]|uniref:RagB/SusD family nutrient uptake outer membrane protein n=1 Tax=Labilibaculum sp. TaxID=2060723 RepID=UPI0035681EE6
MKKYKLYLVVSFMLMLTTSCNDYLTLEPEDDLVQDEFWQTKEQVSSAVAACYASMNVNNFISRVIQWGELRADMLIAKSGSSSQGYMLKNALTASNSLVSWSNFYTTINYCNTVLAYADEAKELDKTFTELELNRYKAEAKAIRSLVYFILVRNFKKVPLITTATLSDQTDFYVAKNTEAEILTQITSDLNDAVEYLADSYTESAAYDKGRMTQGAAYSLLADIYLWNNQFDKAIDACQSVIDLNKYSLVDGSDWFDQIFFEGNSSEGIFELQFSTSFSAMINYYYYSSTADFQTYTNITDLYEDPNDVRADNTTYDSSTGAIFKFTGVDSKTGEYRTTSEFYNNWIFYRYADVLLMQAEGYLLSDTQQDLNKAYNLINQVHERATGTASLAEISVSGLKEELLLERQMELAYEGKRWYDLLRFARRNNFEDQNLITDLVAIKAGVDDYEEIESYYTDTASYFLPIYQDEIDLNPNLEQNPYYEY